MLGTYPIGFSKDVELSKLSTEDRSKVSTAGLLVLRRQFGQLIFGTLMDASGRFQVSFE